MKIREGADSEGNLICNGRKQHVPLKLKRQRERGLMRARGWGREEAGTTEAHRS